MCKIHTDSHPGWELNFFPLIAKQNNVEQNDITGGPVVLQIPGEPVEEHNDALAMI